MPSSLNGTGVTFNDGTQLNSRNEAGGNYVRIIYTSPATWTKPAGLKSVTVTVLGGGGGGGGAAIVDGGVQKRGGRGGAGGSGDRFITGPSIPGPVVVTVGSAGAAGPTGGAGGAGGTSSFGAFLSATGGTGGAFAGGPSPESVIAASGTPGVPSSGDLTLYNGFTNGSFVGVLGAVGLGPDVPAGPSPGIAGQGRGAYGGGANNGAPGPFQPAKAGGAGTGGLVIVEEFY